MRVRSLKGAQLRFYAALGFLLWSVLPHFSAYVHTHSRGQGGHTHGSLSKSQVELAQRLAVSAGEVFGDSALSPSFGLSEENVPAEIQVPHGAALSGSQSLRHGHFQDDANATSTPWTPGDRLIHVPPDPAPAAFPSHPLLRAVRESPARGPPVLPS